MPYEISDPHRFDLARAHGWISRESYWGGHIPFETFARAWAGSLVIGAYAEDWMEIRDRDVYTRGR